MADKYFEHMYRTIKEDGGWNSGHLWKLRQKLHPRLADPPTAMENQHGVLLTDPLEIQNEALRHYEGLFEDLPISPEYEEVLIEKEKLFKIRLESSAVNKTDPWTMSDLECALKNKKMGLPRSQKGMQMNCLRVMLQGRT